MVGWLEAFKRDGLVEWTPSAGVLALTPGGLVAAQRSLDVKKMETGLTVPSPVARGDTSFTDAGRDRWSDARRLTPNLARPQ